MIKKKSPNTRVTDPCFPEPPAQYSYFIAQIQMKQVSRKKGEPVSNVGFADGNSRSVMLLKTATRATAAATAA